MGYSLKDGNKIIELTAEIDRLKAENAELKEKLAKFDHRDAVIIGLEADNAALRAEVKRLNKWADGFTDAHLKERQSGDALIKEKLGEIESLRGHSRTQHKEIYESHQDLDDLACLYERLWENSRAAKCRYLDETHRLYSRLQAITENIAQTERREITALRTQLAKLRKELEWYGDENNYRADQFNLTNLDKDRGQRAREALK